MHPNPGQGTGIVPTLAEGRIVVMQEYRRLAKVWPVAAVN